MQQKTTSTATITVLGTIRPFEINLILTLLASQTISTEGSYPLQMIKRHNRTFTYCNKLFPSKIFNFLYQFFLTKHTKFLEVKAKTKDIGLD